MASDQNAENQNHSPTKCPTEGTEGTDGTDGTEATDGTDVTAKQVQKRERITKNPPSLFLRYIFESSESQPFPKEADKFYLPKMKILIRFARELAIAKDGGRFFLSAANVGDLLGIEPRRAGRWLFKLVECGILRHLKTGNTFRATEYLYVNKLV
jgi:hypothetical protein